MLFGEEEEVLKLEVDSKFSGVEAEVVLKVLGGGLRLEKWSVFISPVEGIK